MKRRANIKLASTHRRRSSSRHQDWSLPIHQPSPSVCSEYWWWSCSWWWWRWWRGWLWWLYYFMWKSKLSTCCQFRRCREDKKIEIKYYRPMSENSKARCHCHPWHQHSHHQGHKEWFVRPLKHLISVMFSPLFSTFYNFCSPTFFHIF